MSEKLIATTELSGKHVVGGRARKRIGKVHFFVFHPTEKRCMGFTVKRPDAALMFKRKDLFVALSGYTVEDGKVVVSDAPDASDKGAIKALGVSYDACVIWEGMPVCTVSGDTLGYVRAVTFSAESGKVRSVEVERSMASDALLGKLVIPSKLIGGFRLGQGAALAALGDYDGSSETELSMRGAIVVADEAAHVETQGGAAAAAGKVTAVAVDKAKKGATKAKKSVDKVAEQAKPHASKVAKKTGEVAERATFAAGRQLGRASGMFAAFKEEFDKASKDDD